LEVKKLSVAQSAEFCGARRVSTLMQHFELLKEITQRTPD